MLRLKLAVNLVRVRQKKNAYIISFRKKKKENFVSVSKITVPQRYTNFYYQTKSRTTFCTDII